MKNRDKIQKINPELIKPDESIKTFQEQLLEYKYGKYPKGLPLVITPESNILGIRQLANLPITINQNIIKKVEEKHSIPIENIIYLEEQIKNHVLAFESMTVKGAVILVLDQKDSADDHVICALHRNVQSVHVEVNAIRSIYGKNNIANMIQNTYNRGKEFYPNKKTNDWIKSIGVQFPKEIINHLSLINDSKESPKSQENPSYRGPRM